MGSKAIVIRVEIPALSELVAYLKDQDRQQQEVDAMAAKVRSVTGKLRQSREALQGAINNQEQ